MFMAMAGGVDGFGSCEGSAGFVVGSGLIALEATVTSLGWVVPLADAMVEGLVVVDGRVAGAIATGFCGIEGGELQCSFDTIVER